MQIQLPRLHPDQLKVANHPARFKVLACGRRWGKTRLGVLLCLKTALEGKMAWWVGPTYKTAEIGWRLLTRLAREVPTARVRLSDKTVVIGDGMVQIRSGHEPDSLRGEGLDWLVMDEGAYIEERAWSEVLRASLADKVGGAMFISTPAGRNWFFRLFSINDGITWKSFNFPTSSNPYIKSEEIAAAKKSLPEFVFRQEFLAEFIHDGIGVFRNIHTSDSVLLGPIARTNYVFGVDWGKFKDFTVITVIDADRNAVVKIDRFNMIDYQLQLKRLMSLYQTYRPVKVVAEANAMGTPLIEQLERAGLPIEGFTTTNASKKIIVEDIALALENNHLTLIPHKALTDELLAFETSRTPSGLLRYSAPEGVHDDCVISLALAWYARQSREANILQVVDNPVANWRGGGGESPFASYYRRMWGLNR